MTGARGEPVVGVLLAAGAGHRLGRGPKALLDVDGTPQVVRMARALLSGGCGAVVVVLGAGGERVLGVLESSLAGTPEAGHCHAVVNPDWATGMGSSFRAGVDAADRLVAGDGSVMVALVDQPDVGEAVVARLLAAPGSRRVRAAGYPDGQGRTLRGHPIVFPARLARQAAALAGGDVAGRAWLRGHPGLVDVVDVGHLATGRDVDTPQDLDRLQRRVRADVRA